MTNHTLQTLKRKNTDTDTKRKKKSRIDNGQADIMQEWPNFRFHSVFEQWQRTACAVMGLPFVRSNRVSQGGANIVLTCHTDWKRSEEMVTVYFAPFLIK